MNWTFLKYHEVIKQLFLVTFLIACFALSSAQTPKGTNTKPIHVIDEVVFKNPATKMSSKKSYTFDIQYTAIDDREIAISLWKNNTWLGSIVERVYKGSRNKEVTLDLSIPPVFGTDYSYKSHIRPVGTDWQQALDTDEITNVTVYEVMVSPNPVKDVLTVHNLNQASYLRVLDAQGQEVLFKNIDKNTIDRVLDVSALDRGFYFISIDNGPGIKFLKE